MYNPEASDFIATLISLAFFLILIGGGIAGYLGRAKPLGVPAIIQDLKDDKIQLGYIDDNETNVIILEEEDEISAMKKQIELLKLKKQLKSLRGDVSQNLVDKDFLNECISMMVNLGEKKSNAKKMVAEILKENPEIKTIDSFAKRVFQTS